MSWRPPKRLPILDKWVEVRQVSSEELKDVVADNDGALGAWDHDTLTIYLLKTLPSSKKQRTYYHEMLHCLIDLFLDP